MITHVHSFFGLHSPSTVPVLITPVLVVDSVSDITIDWSSSHSAYVVRYIVDVREYSSTGPGQVQMNSIADYPQEIPGTAQEHIVKSLSKILFTSLKCYI